MSEMQADLHTQPGQRVVPADCIRVNSDNSNKKAVCLFWVTFALLLIAVFITSNYTPYTFTFKSNRSELFDTHHKDCLNPVSFQKGLLVCEDFNLNNPHLGLIMRNLSPLNQFAQINLILLPQGNDSQSVQIKQTIDIELMSLKRTPIVSGGKTLIGFSKGEDVKTVSGIQFDTHTYYLQDTVTDQARIEKGYEINLGYYRQFKTQDALLIVTFVNIDWEILKNYKVVLTAILMNDNYTKFIMIMRGVFLGIMVFAAGFFIYRLGFKNWSRILAQQSMVINLSIAIILFNDPYYFIGVFKPNVFSIFIETLFLSIFMLVLLSSWVYMLEKINAQSRGREYMTSRPRWWINLLATIDCFIIVFGFNYQIGYYAFNDSPIVPTHKIFSGLFILIIVFFGIVFSYIAYLYIQMYRVWQSVIWRHKLYAVFNIFFIFLLLIFISLGWFSLYDQSSQKFEILYASLNIYVLYMQYMYSRPFGEETREHQNEEFRQLEEISTDMDDFTIKSEPVIDLDDKSKAQEGYPPFKEEN